MIINKDLFLVCEVPFLEPKFGVKPEKKLPDIITITTTRDEAYKIASRYLEYKNIKKRYSVVFISYYNGNNGLYWGKYYNNTIEDILLSIGAEVVQDDMFTEPCPLYFYNPVSCSLLIIQTMNDFRKIVNWVRDGIKNWYEKLNT